MPKPYALNAPEKTVSPVFPGAERQTWAFAPAFWGTAALLFFPPFFRGLFFATEQSKALILAAAVFIFAWLDKHARREYAFLSRPLDYFVLALPLVYAAAAFGAVNYGLAVQEVVKNLLYFLAYWLVLQLAREEAGLVRFLHAAYLAATGVALAGLAAATNLVYIKDGFLNGRIYSSFQYPNALASYLALAGFLGLFFWERYGGLALLSAVTDRTLKKVLPARLLASRPFGYLYTTANFLLLAVLFGTKSRGGLLITGVVFILYLAGLPWPKRLPVLLQTLLAGAPGIAAVSGFIPAAQAGRAGEAWLWIAGGLALALTLQWAYNLGRERFLAPWLADKKRAGRVFLSFWAAVLAAAGALFALRHQALAGVLSFSYLRNLFERFYFVKDALAMLKERPFLGWGGGGWKEAYRAFQDYLYNSNEVHSYYFQVAVEAGLIGLLAVLGLWAAFFFSAHRAYRAPRAGADRKAFVWTLFAAVLAVGAHAVIDFDLSLSALTVTLFAVFAGVRALEVLPAGEASPAEAAAGGAAGRGGLPEKEKGRRQGPPVPAAKAAKKGRAGSGKDGRAAGAAERGQARGAAAGGKKAARRQAPARPALLALAGFAGVFLLALGITISAAYAAAKSAADALSAGQAQIGLASLQRAAALNPLEASYHTNLMHVYLALGRPQEALAEARRAAELSSYSAARRADLASACLAVGDFAGAAAEARRAVALAPYQAAWYETLGSTLSLAGQQALAAGNKEEARRYLEEALQVPDLMNARVASLGEREKRLWKDAPMLAPTPRVYLSTGQARCLLGRPAQAEADLQAAASADDRQLKGEALLWLALAKERQGRTQEAQDLLAQAKEINKSAGDTFEALKKLPLL